MTYIVWPSVIPALKGAPIGWKKLLRLCNVKKAAQNKKARNKKI